MSGAMLASRRGTMQQRPAAAEGYAAEVLADSPYRYWPNWAASPVEDAVADAGDLTLTGAAMNVAGPLSSGDTKAGQFDGVNDYGAASLDLSDTNVVTVEFWLWWDAFANDDDLAMEFTPNYNDSTGGFIVDPNEAGGKFSVGHKGDVGYNKAECDRPSAAAWHLCAFALNKGAAGADEITPYVDGSAVSYTKTGGSANNTNNFANDILVPMSRNGVGLYGAGKMAHLAIYKSALPAGRVAAHFEAA